MKKNYTAFFDFDNTITKFDILDNMLPRFSIDDKWIELENKWKGWKIGSRECLEGQMAGIRITRKALDRYLSTIRLDPYFKKLINLFKAGKIKPIIISDDFDYILKRVLRNNGIPGGLQIYANKLRVVRDRIIPSFPYINPHHRQCGNCKKKNLLANMGRAMTTVYIGDGLSDLCPSREADIVFAKGNLQKYLKKEGFGYIPIKGLKDVYDYFKRSL